MKSYYNYVVTLFFILVSIPFFAQEYSSSNVHAHNDYANVVPFLEAFNNEVGVIEADVYLIENELFVSHIKEDISKERTLQSLYLEPLSNKINSSINKVWKNNKPLALMIDVKSEAIATIEAIVLQVRKYPDLINNPKFQIIISGNRPEASLWHTYPEFILFDGRINENYSENDMKRVAMISEDLKNHTNWNGKGVLTQPDLLKIKAIIEKVHKENKKIRFWATQDNVNTWVTLMNLGVDFIATDNTTALVQFIENKKKYAYQNTDFHQAYRPLNAIAFAKVSKPKNVILLIGDGMGLTQIYAGYTANKGQLNLFQMPVQGFSITKAADSYITDSAAGATAMATGSKTNNRYIGMDANAKPVQSIVSILSKKKYQTAIISSGNATDATPACFYAHQVDRSSNEAIAMDFLSNPSDILIGGGTAEFIKRKDGQDIGALLRNKGFDFSTHFSDLNSIQNNRFVLVDDTAVVSKKAGRGDFLTEAFDKTITTFLISKKPFFIMEEGAQIDYGGHKNEVDYVVKEMLDFDKLVGAAMKFADENKETLVIVTADHETGGLSIIDGDVEKGYVHGNFSTNDHTAVNVPVFAYGPGASRFSGVYQNNELFFKIKNLLSE